MKETMVLASSSPDRLYFLPAAACLTRIRILSMIFIKSMMLAVCAGEPPLRKNIAMSLPFHNRRSLHSVAVVARIIEISIIGDV